MDFKIAGVSNTDIKEWNIEIDNGASGLKTLNLSQDVSDIVTTGKWTSRAAFDLLLDGS